MWRFILRENIARWRQLLSKERSEHRRAELLKCIVDAGDELDGLDARSHHFACDNAALLSVAQHAVDEGVKLGRAQFGTLQLFDRGSGALLIAAQRNFRLPFLTHFAAVKDGDGSACGRALGSGQHVLIEDVARDLSFQPHLSVARTAGFQAVHSMPLLIGGRSLGVLSIHYACPRRFSEDEILAMQSHAQHAAKQLDRHLTM